MPAGDLVAAVRTYQRAQKQIDEAREHLAEAIANAIDEGWRPVDVMEVTGYSRERIRQITRDVKKNRAGS